VKRHAGAELTNSLRRVRWRNPDDLSWYTRFPSSAVTLNSKSGDLMEEQRKHAILFAATLLCARKVIESMESDKPNFAKQCWVDRAVDEAGFILERIDKRWPTEGVGERER
jgi:hypothetical protein